MIDVKGNKYSIKDFQASYETNPCAEIPLKQPKIKRMLLVEKTNNYYTALDNLCKLTKVFLV